MKELQAFQNDRFGEIRVVEIDGEPWFVGKDVAAALGYANPNEAIQDHVDVEDKLNSKSLSSFDYDLGQRGGWLINESGLYSLVMESKLPDAKRFKRWVTSVVLPAIRKTGGYTVKPMADEEKRVLEVRDRESRVQASNILREIAERYRGTDYEQILLAHSTHELTGEFLLPLPVLEEKTLSASELGAVLEISANKVGRIAKVHGLKTESNGRWFKDRAQYVQGKEVESFRYFPSAVEAFRPFLN